MRECVGIGALDPVLAREQGNGAPVIQPDGAALGTIGKSNLLPGTHRIAAAVNADAIRRDTHGAGKYPAGARNCHLITAVAIDRGLQPCIRGDLLCWGGIIS